MKRFSYEKRKSMYGRMFISVWVLGVLVLFITTLLYTMFYSTNTLNFKTLKTTAAGFSYYYRLFFEDTGFVQKLCTELLNLLYEVPIVVMFSVFIAVLLNRQFTGRLFFRAVFFLPVIVMSGVVLSLLSNDTQSTEFMAKSGDTTNAMLNKLTTLQDLLSSFGFGDKVITFLSNVVNRVEDVIWKSGVQILLCLAGLQSVSPVLYEAARIEGASKWEEFWKITFPMLMPVLLVSIIYSIIDSFTSDSNAVITYINTVSFQNFEYSYGCAMSLTYCVIMLIVIGLVAAIIGKSIVYTEK